MARRIGRVDLNQKQIVATARQMGASVVSLATIGQGCPDVLVAFGGVLDLWEIKNGELPPSAQKLTKDEFSFHERWKSPIQIIRSESQAIRRIQELGQVSIKSGTVI